MKLFSGPVVQASALDLLIKSTPTVIVAVIAFYFSEVQDQRQDAILQKLIAQQQNSLDQMRVILGNCVRIAQNYSEVDKLLEGTDLIDPEIQQLKELQEKYGREMR